MKYKIKKNLIWSIIPAKGNSKRIKRKNLKKIDNIELFLYSVLISQKSTKISKTFISTEDRKILKIAANHGAETPFLRPKKFSKFYSEDHEYIFHFLNFILKNYSTIPEYIVQLRPTTPFRSLIDINKAINLIKSKKKSTSLRSSHLADHPPEKQFRIKKDFYCDINLIPDEIDLFNKPSQFFRKTYEPNGYIDILKTEFLLKNKNKKKLIYGNKILPFITEKKIDIDTIEDFNYAQKIKNKDKIEIKKFFKKK